MSLRSSQHAASPKRSLDGYIRLTFDALSSLNFQRKLAWEDPDLQQDLIVEDVPAFCAGYCEWATNDVLQVSIGWAWFGLANGRRFIAPGGISSNVMLVTQTSYDLGMHRTDELLRAWLSGESWQISGAISGL
ncbi:hypothetical protein B0E46_13800 [Rhodanobacter sp. B04]|uniref:DUF4902 domain-containing protein n=1 Tax=Rhodanobacter sp. B04 TaxID=1945860 RepID=UPI00098668C0|nr:DUF4902 domain-containing protein [Rhodanobacter sp. B04]OOG62060.1 hypothetical protein B0E46_13800 [Rhodanobacter sp. B04]